MLHDIRQGFYRAFVAVTEGNSLFLRIHVFLIGHQDRYLRTQLCQFKRTW